MKLKTPKFPGKGHHDTAPAPVAMQSFPQAPAPQSAPAQPAHIQAPPTGPAPAAPQSRNQPVSPLKKATSGLAAPTRQRNAAMMIAGAVFVILSAALAASVASSFDDSIQVLVAANEIAEGQPVTEGDFRTVEIAAGEGDIQAVSPESIEDLVGRVAAGPIGEGSMVHPAQFAIASEESQVVIGAALGPNRYPASGLKPGDQVRLIEVSDRFDADLEESGVFSSGREITIGVITDVVRLSQRDTLHFSIRVGESAGSVVAQRVAQDRLTLALVDESIILERVDPLDAASPVVPLDVEEDEEAGE